MSCTTTSLSACTIKKPLTSEDPYVFTETTPATSPILFNNSQKSRNRLIVKHRNISPTKAVDKFPTTASKKSAFSKVKSSHGSAKTQTSLSATLKATNLNTSAVLGVLNTNDINKYGPKLSAAQQTKQQHVLFAQNENATANANAVVPALVPTSNNRHVQQQKIQQKNYQQQSSTPPPLFLSHTPSLWQTPLLLDSPLESSCTSSSNTNKIITTTTKRLTTNISIPTMSMSTSTPTPTPTLAATALLTPISAVNEEGNIAPLHLIMPSAAPLPPSNFHNTTLAQHLQKVQCLKKSKKLSSPPPPTLNTATETVSDILGTTSAPSTPATDSKTQHSTTDLNEIPVNVIFRSPTKAETCPAANVPTETNQMGISIAERTSTQSSSKQTNQKRKNTSLIGQQLQQQQLQSSPPQLKQRKLPQKTVVVEQHNTPTTTMFNKRKTIVNVPKLQKRSSKVSSLSTHHHDQSEIYTIDDISSKTKALAVVRMPYKELEADISLLANESVLPYCIQRHWYDGNNERPLRSTKMGREQRIIEYKNLLRRQAMQLLATRSLQQLPFHIARKRLICVKDLLSKYRDHNKTAGNETVKKCCEVENCGNTVLEMTSYCRQHVAKNTKQCIFVQCSGKSLKDNQKPCGVPVLNIKKPYSAPLCYIHTAYQQQKQEQQRNICNISTLNTSVKSPINRKRKTPATITTTTTTTLCNLSSVNVMKANATDTFPKRNGMGLQRKNSTTSLESIASNSHSSFASSCMYQGTITGQTENANFNAFHANMLSPPSLAPLSYNNNNNNNNNNKSHNNHSSHREQHSLYGGSGGRLDPTAEQEINKLVAQFAMVAEATATATPTITKNNSNNNNNNNNYNSFNYMNTNSNSNLTSSGVGSSSSLPSTDELLTQDMLSICENSSAYASSSEDTGLGELSENELMATNNSVLGNGGMSMSMGLGVGIGVGVNGGFNDDDVSPDEIPLGDARLLEENDLVNVFGTLPVNLNELFETVVRQDEREEVERALEIADKHLKTLQETIGSDSDFLADFLNDVNDDMLADTDDICSKMEIVSSCLSPPESLDDAAASLYLENTKSVHHGTGNCVNAGNSNNSSVMDVRGLLQT